MTPKQVGKALGFKPRTITRWCREGRLKGAVKMGRVWRIPSVELIEDDNGKVKIGRVESV